MPRRFFRRKFYKRRTNFRRRYGSKLATRSYVKKQIKKEIETKYIDYNYNNSPIAGAGILLNLSAFISQGTSDNERIGDKINLRGIHFRMSFWDNSNTQGSLVRMTIFQWKPNTASYVPSTGAIFAYNTSPQIIWSPFNHDLSQQYTILYDKLFYMQDATNIEWRNVWKKKVNIKYAKKLIQFVGAGTNGTNHIYLSLQTNSPTNNPVAYGSIRQYYDDA